MSKPAKSRAWLSWHPSGFSVEAILWRTVLIPLSDAVLSGGKQLAIVVLVIWYLVWPKSRWKWTRWMVWRNGYRVWAVMREGGDVVSLGEASSPDWSMDGLGQLAPISLVFMSILYLIGLALFSLSTSRRSLNAYAGSIKRWFLHHRSLTPLFSSSTFPVNQGVGRKRWLAVSK